MSCFSDTHMDDLSGIQGFVHHGRWDGCALVQYEDCSMEEEDQQVEGGRFNITSKNELKAYDRCKTVLGVEVGTPPCQVIDSEDNEVKFVCKTDAKPFLASVKYKTLLRGVTVVTEDNTMLSPAAKKHLERIQDLVSKDCDQAMSLASEFLCTFPSHYVTGIFNMGGIFEWVVICDDESNIQKFKAITWDILNDLQFKDKLLGSSVGEWYSAKDILLSRHIEKYSKDVISAYKVRVTKLGGIDERETLQDWTENLQKCDAKLVPISGEDIKVVPLLQHNMISKYTQFTKDFLKKVQLDIMQKQFPEIQSLLKHQILEEKNLKLMHLYTCFDPQQFNTKVDEAIDSLQCRVKEIHDELRKRRTLESYDQGQILSLEASSKQLEEEMVQDLRSFQSFWSELLQNKTTIKLMMDVSKYVHTLKGKELSESEMAEKFEECCSILTDPEHEVIDTNVIRSQMEMALIRQLYEEGHSVDDFLLFLRGKNRMTSLDLQSGISHKYIYLFVVDIDFDSHNVVATEKKHQ